MSNMGDRRFAGGIPAEALGQPSSPPAAAAITKLAARRARVARGELATLPVYGQVWIQVLGPDALEAIESAVLKSMRQLEIPQTPLNLGTFNLSRFKRILAQAVRDDEDPTHRAPFGTLEQWGEEPDDFIVACIRVYKDVKARLDPAAVDDISDETIEEITELFKKKDWTQLRSIDGVTLANWLRTGAVQLSSSPTAA